MNCIKIVSDFSQQNGKNEKKIGIRYLWLLKNKGIVIICSGGLINASIL